MIVPVKQILATLAFASTVFAHVRMTAISVNGGAFDGSGVRLPPNNSPVEDVSSPNIACNVNGNSPASGITVVPAGATVRAKWDSGAHPGPNIVYLARVSDAKTTNVNGLSWFKIAHEGLKSSSGGNAVWSAPTSDGNYSFRIPSSIAAGYYLLRVETIGLHVAQNYPGAQFYMSCVQIQVTGGGGSSPGGISFPGGYSGSHPGIKLNIYYPVPTSYSIPGPAPVS